MIKKISFVVAGLSLIAFTAWFFISSDKKNEPQYLYQKAYQKYAKVLSPTIPAHVDFCGEPVPIDTFYIYEALDKEVSLNAYMHGSTLLYLKRAYRWFPVIEPILKKNNIPEDFKYLMVAESGVENRVSSANAAGYWQFLKETGIRFGLEINEEVDQRYDMEKATEAACKYLKDAYSKLNSWTLVAAAYNCGTGGATNRLEDQGVKSYYDLQMPQETMRYVFRIVALKIIMKDPVKYGFLIRTKDMYPPLNTTPLNVSEPISDLTKFAKDHNTTLRIIKELNPWLKKNSLTNPSRKTYTILIPADSYLSNKKLKSSIPDNQIYGDTVRVDQLN